MPARVKNSTTGAGSDSGKKPVCVLAPLLNVILQSLAEITKHFKILVTRFSARASWRTVVLTKAVIFEISRHGALWKCLIGQGPL